VITNTPPTETHDLLVALERAFGGIHGFVVVARGQMRWDVVLLDPLEHLGVVGEAGTLANGGVELAVGTNIYQIPLDPTNETSMTTIFDKDVGSVLPIVVTVLEIDASLSKDIIFIVHPYISVQAQL
jgi:hypothetical protein